MIAPDDILPEESASVAPMDLKRARRARRPAASDRLNNDRLPPYSMETEQGVLGCILLSPQDCIPICIEIIGEDPEVFYDLRHQTIYANLISMFESGKPADMIALYQRLKDFEMAEQIGGIPYLNALQDAVPSAANVAYYARIVKEKYILRKLILVCSEIIGRVYEYEGDVESLVDGAERDILSISEKTESTSGMIPIKEPVREAVQSIENYLSRNGAVTGIPTGFPDLDMLTNGCQNGDMIIIAARPSIGKTSLAMNIAESVALNSRIPVGVFSLEMTRQALALRMITSQSRVSLRSMTNGFASESDIPKLTSAAGRLYNSPIFVDDTPALSVLKIRTRARRANRVFGVKLFIIDYLQLVKSTSARAKTREQEIADVSSALKALAKELNVPIIVLAQLNRELEREKNRKPRLSDLRESGSIEQDADVVGMLYRVATEGDADDEIAIPVNLLVAKQRNGPTGVVNLTFIKSYTRFESAAKVSDEDVTQSQQGEL